MALSGSFYKYPTSKFGLYCDWRGVQSITGNYTNITLKVYLQFYQLSVSSRSDSTISINGTTETYTAPAINDLNSSSWHKVLLKTKTVTVYHDSSGKKNGVPLSASWRFSGSYGGVSIGTITASTKVNLNSIDRSAPTISLSTSSITANSFKISASSSAPADTWQYSINGGSSWTTFSNNYGTSNTATITGLSPNNTYTVKVRARKNSNYVYGTSNAIYVKTLGGAVLNSVNDFIADMPTAAITLNTTVYDSSYSHTLEIKNGSTTYLTINNLSWSKGTSNRSITLTPSQRSTLLQNMASLKSFNGTFAVTSYKGNSQVGDKSSKTAPVQTTFENSAPTLSDFSYEDSNATTINITGNKKFFIQSCSDLIVTPGVATAKNSATITNYTATCNGVSVSNKTGSSLIVGKISKSGTISVVVSVTDSRGYTTSVKKDISVIPYAKPKLSNITLRRTNDIEAEMQLIFNGSLSPITVDGNQKNSLSFVGYRYKLTSADTYGNFTQITSLVTQSGSNFSFSNKELCSLDANSSYDFQVQIIDRIGEATAVNFYFTVPQGTPLIALRKKKVGINTSNPTVALDVVGDAKISGNISANSISGKKLNVKLSTDSLDGILPISKGGTGANNVAGAIDTFINQKEISPACIDVGTNRFLCNNEYGLHLHNSDIIGVNAIFFPDTINAYDEGIIFYRSETSWDRLYACDGVLYFAPNQPHATHPGTRYTVYHSGGATIPLNKGGTGATSAYYARNNLGITCTSLWSGSLTKGSCSFNYGSYKSYIIAGQPNTNAAKTTVVVPKSMITTSSVNWQITDEAYYRLFTLKYSGSKVTLTAGGGYGRITNVYGVN